MGHAKRKAPAGCDPDRGKSCNCLKPCIVEHFKQPTLKTQPSRMGTTLRYFLKQYAADLHPLAESGKNTLRIVDCRSHLLIESDRLEGGTYD